MGIFAADIGLRPIFLQILFDLSDRKVHGALYVRGVRVPLIPRDTLIVYDPGRIPLMKCIVHGHEIRPAERFISEGPDKDGRVVLVPLVHGTGAVQNIFRVLGPVTGERVLHRMGPVDDMIPDTVRLQIGLIDEIKAIQVAEPVDQRAVRVMAQADRIDVVALHGENILDGLLIPDRAPGKRGEFVAVHTAEDDPLPVQTHHVIFDLEAPEPDFLRDDFREGPGLIPDVDHKVVEIRIFRGPFVRILHRKMKFRHSGFPILPAVKLCLFPQELSLSVHERDHHFAGHTAFQHDLKIRVLILVVKKGADPKILDMYVRKSKEIHVAEEAAHTEEILVLEPAPGSEPEDLYCELVLLLIIYKICQVELGGREGVLGISDKMPVEPDRQTALRALERDAHRAASHEIGHVKISDITRDRVEFLRDLTRLNFLRPVPRELGIDILRMAVPLHLDMGGDADRIPGTGVIV